MDARADRARGAAARAARANDRALGKPRHQPGPPAGAPGARDGIPAALPPGTRVAHKPGRITGHSHDAALVLPRGRPPYALVVLTRGFEDERAALGAIRAISRAVW